MSTCAVISVSVGYEYESCLDLTLWEKRTAILQGYELDASNMGGWTLDKHHVLDVQNGKELVFFLLVLLLCCPALQVSHSNFLLFALLFLQKENVEHFANGKCFELP